MSWLFYDLACMNLARKRIPSDYDSSFFLSQYTQVFILDLFRLDGQVALVSGSGLGLSNVFARALGAAGATVVSADIDLASAEKTAEDIRLLGGKASSVAVDVSDAGSVEAMSTRALKERLAGCFSQQCRYRQSSRSNT